MPRSSQVFVLGPGWARRTLAAPRLIEPFDIGRLHYERHLALFQKTVPVTGTFVDTQKSTHQVVNPPGIPLMMPGENVGQVERPVLEFLRARKSFGQAFLEFAHDTHGIESEGGFTKWLPKVTGIP